MTCAVFSSFPPGKMIACSMAAMLCGLAISTAETLQEAAGKRLLVGAAITSVDLKDPALADMVARQFGCITPEYELMPEKLVDDSGKFNFTQADQVVAFAEAHKMPVLGHMLVWHFFSRKWLFEDASGKPLPREKALENLKLHIDTVTGHYKGRIKAWDVVNEAISDKDGEYLRDTPALRAIGGDYIAKAFEFAHAADPKAELYYNDYNIEQPGKLERAVRLLGDLKAAGVRIDAVGIQGHWLIGGPSAETIGKGIDALAATGVKVMITELDVDVLPRQVSGADMKLAESGENPFANGLPPEMQRKLAKRYSEIITEITRHPSVTVIGFWGTHDGRSWLNDFPVKHRTNHPLLFDRAYQAKPAFETAVKALKTSQKSGDQKNDDGGCGAPCFNR